VFGVSIKGSFVVLTLCTLLYVMVATGIGMVTSTFTGTQVHPAHDPVRRADPAGVDAAGRRFPTMERSR
jgi:hypothetical protein